MKYYETKPRYQADFSYLLLRFLGHRLKDQLHTMDANQVDIISHPDGKIMNPFTVSYRNYTTKIQISNDEKDFKIATLKKCLPTAE